ncbi:protein phosphatase 2C domain-containing protein [Streptomyces sp. NPDC059851]|uniref:protein phosphatase 2C domain-containing protein n=1 Tax=Streptomyces sp. NPDC059851 TaxID=3346971 RepID=UPI0036468FB3
MSQQGADDWWQRLYEDPDAGPTPDPGDTLESRYHSAASVTSTQAPPGVPPQPGPPDAGAPPPRPGTTAPGHGDSAAVPPPSGPPGVVTVPSPGELAAVPAQPLPPDPAAPQVPPVSGRPGPEAPPVSGRPGPKAPVPAPPRPAAAPSSRPGAAAETAEHLPGGRQPDGPVGAEGLGAAQWTGAGTATGTATGAGATAGAGAGLPRPRDPRENGTTGYGLGDVTVPPVPADEAAPAHPPAPLEPAPEPPRPPAAPPLPQAPPTPVRPEVRHLGDRAPTYSAEPGALPLADPVALDTLIPDTVLEGARHGACTLRAASVRGDSARYRGEARRDVLLTARFGTGDDALVLVALAGGDRAAGGAAEAAAELCHWIGTAVGRSQPRLAEDIRAGRRDALRSGLQRLTDRGYGRLRARAAELGHPEDAYTAGLRALLLPIDPECRTRICFGAGSGGLFRLRSGAWQDLETAEPTAAARPDGEPGHESDPESGHEPGPGFRFRAAVARPGDTLLLCSGGLADPMREEELLPAELAARWSAGEPPGLAAFLADTQLRVKGYADDRTAAAVWDA